MSDEKTLAIEALKPLMAFQKKTVDYVFGRFYGKDDPIRHFLVADEVGLGKTMVARGIIAKMIDHLWESVERIDIIYICSNQAIAAQNINRLNVLDREDLALPTRITLLPLQQGGPESLNANRVNFISLTPGTSFDLRSATGIVKERALLYRMLKDVVSRQLGLFNLLQVGAKFSKWEHIVRSSGFGSIDESIAGQFRCEVSNDRDLFEELERLCEIFIPRRKRYPHEMKQPRNALIGKLRAKLSRVCVGALEPDLIILDEFQRFRELLRGDSDAAILAQEMFRYRGVDGNAARTLLLSATPYRMLTLKGDDEEEGDHYQDFLETLRFLFGEDKGNDVVRKVQREMQDFRGFLQNLPHSHEDAVKTRKRIECRLRQVIARTERVSKTAKRDSMICEPNVPVSVNKADIQEADALSDVVNALDAPDSVEYWKSAPYALSFMRAQYKLRRMLDEQANAPSIALRKAVKAARPAMLNRSAIEDYRPLVPSNGRMRSLVEDMCGSGHYENLWIPPAIPYYGDPRSGPPITKALVFSSWSMVPDAVAAIISYEAERRMVFGERTRRKTGGKSRPRYFEPHNVQKLRFQQSQGKSAGLRVLQLIYPSPKLAELADPLAIFAENEDLLQQKKLRKDVAKRLAPALESLGGIATGNGGAALAGWAAPAVVDDLLGSSACDWRPDGMDALGGEEAFRETWAIFDSEARRRDFGALPEGLDELLVDVALGSPAVCALRALRRIAPELGWDDPCLLGAAAKVAWAFRALFNQHDATSLVSRLYKGPYWRRVLKYCADRNLQAVLDEYAHYLVDAQGLGARSHTVRANGVANAMVDALSIHPSRIDADDIRVKGDMLVFDRFHLRGRFAMRLGGGSDEEGAVLRLGNVRDSFNSPFRPFVLATTSIGQEGLDFHPYCYRIYHWNLPGNPVDLEQREGRVHRFKGHAVRLNLADRQAVAILGSGQTPEDPWKCMFEKERSNTRDQTDLIPYWICEGQVKVERRVPMLPFSREATRIEWLKLSLAIYRLAFGQPRQDDLIEYLQRLIQDGAIVLSDEQIDKLQIRLSPSEQ